MPISCNGSPKKPCTADGAADPDLLAIFRLGRVNTIEFFFSGKEDESAVREYSLTVFDRDGRHNLTQPEGKKA
jgi:hypothetical protein